MIDYVKQACRTWGLCTRWILLDTNEGFPSRDTIERARSGLLGMKPSFARQHFPEVRLGDALLIARAIAATPVIPLPLHAALWAQHVARAKPPERVRAVSLFLGEELTTAEYYRNLDRAYYFLASRLPAAENCDECHAA